MAKDSTFYGVRKTAEFFAGFLDHKGERKAKAKLVAKLTKAAEALLTGDGNSKKITVLLIQADVLDVEHELVALVAERLKGSAADGKLEGRIPRPVAPKRTKPLVAQKKANKPVSVPAAAARKRATK